MPIPLGPRFPSLAARNSLAAGASKSLRASGGKRPSSYNSAGLGTSYVPVRFNRSPEIVLVTLGANRAPSSRTCDATVSTDKLKSYAKLARLGYVHGVVNHAADEWTCGAHHTNSLEGFWSLLKRSIRGTHVHVSRKHLAKYLGEFEFRCNSRHVPMMMFPRLLLSF
jgi:hypothetical protein